MNRSSAARVSVPAPSGTDLKTMREQVDARLQALAPPAGGDPMPLADAIRHALLAPGKRTRPVMTLLCTERFGGVLGEALDAACAFEMVHAASLLFDDLPCMDDALLRRGRPTAHRLFGQDAAVLAGVTLLNEAFGVLARSGLDDRTARRLAATLSGAVGLGGLASGQMRDIRESGSQTVDTLLRRNHEKTGVLFCAAAEAGAIIGGAGEAERAAVCEFARRIGAAYQIRDDLLDATGQAQGAGKDVGQDGGKATFVSLLGVDGARAQLAAERAGAVDALARLGEPGALGAFLDRLLALDWLEPAAAGERATPLPA